MSHGLIPGGQVLTGIGREIGTPFRFNPFRSLTQWIKTFEQGVMRMSQLREPLFRLVPEEMSEDTLSLFRDTSGQEYAVHREGDKLRIWILGEE